MMTDLEELERLHAGLPVLRAETWNHEDGEGYAAIIAVIDSDCDDDEHPGAYDAAVAGVRILNALPGLIAELSALREVEQDANAYLQKLGGSWHATEHKLRNSLAKAALAKVPK